MEENEISQPYSYNSISDKMKILKLVNILQPVTKTTLLKHLPKTIRPESISSILTELLQDNLLSKERRYYRVTTSGLSFNLSKQSKKLRDITRMKYLLQTTKQRGGDSLGR